MKNFSHLMLFKAESPNEADNVIVCSNILGKRRKYWDYFTYKGRTVGPIFIYILNQFHCMLSHCFLNFRWLIICFVVCIYCSFILINCIGFPSRRLSCLCEWLARQIVKSKSKSKS